MATVARPGTRRTSASEVSIRRADPGDFDTVLELRRALRREEHPDSPMNDRDLIEMTRRQLRGTSQVVLLAVAGGEAVGVLRCALQAPVESGPSSALLTTAYVVPAWRRLGVMARLVAAAEAWSTALGVEQLRLRNAAGNDTANAAWEAMGFATVQVVRQRAIRR